MGKKNVSFFIVCILLLITAFLFTACGEDAPELKLKGSDTVSLTFGQDYVEPGYEAINEDGQEITDKVKVSVPKMQRPGKYEVKYQVTENGLTSKATRKVNVTYPKAASKGGPKTNGLAVYMYHNVYNPKNPPDHIDANYISKDLLEQQLKYLISKGYYFPTWKEVRRYVEGEIGLPEKSVVLTFDDATNQFIQNGIPLLEKYDVRATSFVIASKKGKRMVNGHYKHIDLESHSYNMHRPGGTIGHGGIFTALSYDEGLADLKNSIKILGNGDAFAYPFGDYNNLCKKEVEDAGFLVAFTTEYGKVNPGDDPYLLRRIRINGDMSLDAFVSTL